MEIENGTVLFKGCPQRTDNMVQKACIKILSGFFCTKNVTRNLFHSMSL